MIVPRGQDRPRVLVERNRTENRHTSCTRRDLQFDEGRGTSLTISPLDSRSSSRLSYRTPSSTPINPPVSRSVDTERQLLQLQRQIATLTEKVDSLKESTNLANLQRANTRRDENLPKDMVVSTVFLFQVAWRFQRNLTSLKYKILSPETTFLVSTNNTDSDSGQACVSEKWLRLFWSESLSARILSSQTRAFFTITTETRVRSLANWTDMNLSIKFMRRVSERERAIRQFVIVKNKLMSVFNASVLLLTMNFVITLSK